MKTSMSLPSNVDIPSDKEGLISLFLMIFNLLSVAISIGTFYFLPLAGSFFIGIVLYSLLVFTEIKFQRLTPVTVLILLIYIFLSITYFIFDQEEWMPYSGSVFYFSLGLMAFILSVLKKPLTMYYSLGKGMLSLHNVTSWMWVAIYFMAGITSILLMPNVSFIYVPSLLIMAGLLATLFFQFCYLGPSSNRKKEFTMDMYDFKEIDSPQAIDQFYTISSTEIWSAIAQSKKKSVKTQSELMETMIRSDQEYTDGIVRFIAYSKEGNPIGTIFCVIDSPQGLPIERDTGINMANLRKMGKVIEVGHFVIDKRYRCKPDLFLGLFKGVIDFALAHDISFLANCSYSHSSAMYEKMGFVKISSCPIPDTILGVDTCPSILNLARLVVYHEDITMGIVEQSKPILNQYTAERYYKRRLATGLFTSRKPYNLKIEDIFNKEIYAI